MKLLFNLSLIVLLALGGLAAGPAPLASVAPSRAPAVSIIVTRFDDPTPSGCSSAVDCSLREAIIAANATLVADVILLPSGTYTLTRAGEDDLASVGDLDIFHSLTINVTGGVSATIGANAAHNDRIIHVRGAGTVVNLTNLIIQDGDTQSTNAGGGLRVESSDTVVLQNVLVRNNHAGGNAGGILNIGTLTLNNSTVINNIAGGADGGGGVFNDDNATLVMTGGAVISNSLSNANGGGGGLYLDTGSTANLHNVKMLSNTAGANSGGGGLLAKNTSTTDMNLVVLAGNDGGSTGGSIFNDGHLHANATQFFNNHADDSGGAIINRGDVSLFNSSIISNSAFGAVGATGGGAVLQAPGATLVMSHTSLLSNTAGLAPGGALLNPLGAQMVLTDTVIAGNHGGNGGGISNGGSLNLLRGEIRANQAITNGGGLFNTGRVDLNATAILSNSSLASGGGIDNEPGSRVVITGGQIISNSTVFSGGGAFVRPNSHLTLSGTLLAHNQAGNGGAIFITGGGTVTATNSVFSENRADFNGGGINSTGLLTLLDSAAVSNTAQGVGGGLKTSGILSATNITFSGNTAQGDGGGLSAGGNVTINNVTIASNHSLTGSGGGLQTTATGVIFNTLIAANSAGGSHPDCDGLFVSLDHNLVQNADGCTFLGPTIHTLTNTALVVGPLTAFGATWAHPLLALSPARDAGDNSLCAAHDQRGQARPVGSQCDIGAIEATDTLLLFLPALAK